MPLFKIDRKIHYYAHVPKCAGSSVENYLEARFGSLALKNEQWYNDKMVSERWGEPSPQHISANVMASMIPEDWISSSFAVVRHPVDRFVSAFNFQSQALLTMPPGVCPMDLIRLLDVADTQGNHLYDDHFRPMSDIVPKAAKIFHMEEGFADLVAHLDTLSGSLTGPREVPHVNETLAREGADFETIKLSADSLKWIERRYLKDFERFGYEIRSNSEYRIKRVRRVSISDNPRRWARQTVQRASFASRPFRLTTRARLSNM
jgi:hypothetical protein